MGGLKLKNIKFSTQFNYCSLKTKVIITTAIMGIALVSVLVINNINPKSSTSSRSSPIIETTTKPVLAGYTTQHGVITASSLSVRSGAGTNYSSVAKMKKGTNVIVLGKINDFYKITYGGKTRYISAQYVKITVINVTVRAFQF